MSDGFQPSEEVAKSRKGLMAALLGILLVIAAIVAVMYLVGIGPFAVEEPAPVVTKPKPAAQASEEAEEETVTPVASEATVPLPPADAQEVMYWEQVASAQTIGELMNNEFSTFELSQVTESSNLANIRVKGTYRDGTQLTGWLVLKKFEGAWYFASITADGHTGATPDLGDPDQVVMKAMVEQQAANQDVYNAIVDGTYNTMTVDKVIVGSGANTLEVTLSGNAKAGDVAKLTAISKEVGTGTQWFITGFSM